MRVKTIDFYCAEARVFIEIDGESHLRGDQLEYDRARTEYLESLAYKLIRFTNNDVGYNVNAVIATSTGEVERRIKE